MKKKKFDMGKGFQGYDINKLWIDEDIRLTLEDLEDNFKKCFMGDWSSSYEELTINKVINFNIFKFLCITETQYHELSIKYQNSLSKFFSNMKISQAAIIGKRKELLEYYIEMFNEIPSGSHMVRAYTYMEQIFLDKYSKSEITVDEKQIERFDKLKALALNNANINERKAAFTRSVKQFCKIAAMEDLKISEEE